MNIVNNFIPQELVQALGWTLLHSLWQGALVALALSLVLVFLNRHSSQVRYFISITALFTTLALSVFTFFNLYEPAATVAAVREGAIKVAAVSALPATVASLPETNFFDKLPFVDFFVSYFEKHLPLLVTLWFMGIVIMALRMLGGLAYIQRLRHYQARESGTKWQNKLTELCGKLEFKKPVKLMESLQVKVPVAIGYLKPIILIPVGAVNGLSEKQVEAILAHELAHIVRNDYLFNLIQSFVETVFFYHPAMWWINACVPGRRENCCDDIAITLCGDSFVFAGALAELEEMNFACGPGMAMALNGKKGTLLARIKRLVTQPKRSASFSEGFIAGCILMVSISAISISAMAEFRPNNAALAMFIPDNNLESLTAPVSKTTASSTISTNTLNVTTTAHRVKNETAKHENAGMLNLNEMELSVSKAPDGDGKDIIIVKDKKGNIVEMYVDGRKIPKKQMAEFKEIIARRTGAPAKSKKQKKEQAMEEEMDEIRDALTEIKPSKRFEYSYTYPGTGQSRSRGRSVAPMPPVPPLPPLVEVAPMAPMRPMKPIRPMKPMKPMAPPAGSAKEDRKEYEADLKEYEAEVKEYDAELKDYENTSSAEWKEYEAEMKEFEIEMETFGREMEVWGKELGKSIEKSFTDANFGENIRRQVEESLRAAGVTEKKEIEKRIYIDKDRANAAAGREREAVNREKAAEARAKAADIRAKAAAERAKAAAKRSIDAEKRAKAAAARSKRIQGLKTELRKDKLIGENEKNFSYKINSEGLYINDKKQSQALYEKYRKMFHPEAGTGKNSTFNETYIIRED